MRHPRITLFLVATVFALLPACGGSGNGFGVVIDPLVITSSTIDSSYVSGDVIDWEIPLSGGCSGSGPFVVEIITGALPLGVGVDFEDGRHHIVGIILDLRKVCRDLSDEDGVGLLAAVLEFPSIEGKRPKAPIHDDAPSPRSWIFESSIRKETAELVSERPLAQTQVEYASSL